MSHSNDIITKQEFAIAYKKLNIAQSNFSKKSSKLLWEDIQKIFAEMKVKLHVEPTTLKVRIL